MLLDAVVFAGNENPVRDVMVGGRWVVTEGRHVAEQAVLKRYRAVLAELTDSRLANRVDTLTYPSPASGRADTR